MRDAMSAVWSATVFVSLMALCRSNSWSTQCGWVTINPATSMCCSGLVYVKGGISPTCCGSIAYDAHYSICCNGRVHRKSGMLSRCCGQSRYDVLSSVCVDGSIVPRRSLASTTCCHTEVGWKCCSKGDVCPCNPGGSGSVEVPGFRPACCEIVSRNSKAQCCSMIVQKTGLMPSCCNNDRVRPICCRSTSRSYRCCAKSYGIPACCTNAVSEGDSAAAHLYQPSYHLTTTLPSYLIPVQPTPFPQGGSCCQSLNPHGSCCQALKQTVVQVHGSNHVSKAHPPCCTYRSSCCSVADYNRFIACCQSSRPGHQPLCCKGPTPKPPEHRCYACKLKADYNSKPAPLLIDSDEAKPVPQERYFKKDSPDSARLSCCRSINLRQCCIDGIRLSGTYIRCCTSEILSRGGSNHGHGSRLAHDQGSPGNLMASQPSRMSVCSSKSYNVEHYMCCRGIVRIKHGKRPGCCGSLSFDMARQECCNGMVRRTCARRYTIYRHWKG